MERKRKTMFGSVVSDKMGKTVVVAVETRKVHPLYKKAIRRTKKYKVHDPDNVCKIGNKVKIVETRPLSKEKRWRVVEIVSKGEMAEARTGQEHDSELHETQGSR